jgi:uncharacterized protein
MVNVESTGPAALDPQKRLSPDDTFQFACGPQVPCFTECCGKLELLLTPYDALRLRKRLGVSSEEFLDTYAVIRWKTRHGFPEVLMKMDPDAEKRCPFVTPRGCSEYEDRPAACRIYPLGRASTRHPLDGSAKEFYFTVREDHCKGFEETKVWKVSEWLDDQGLETYNRMNDLLMDLYVLKSRRPNMDLATRHLQMFMMACYNQEKFREFLFKSGFLDKFEVESELVEGLKGDDTQLLEFAFLWLKFALFQEPVLKIRGDVARETEDALKEKRLQSEETIEKDFRG